MKINRKDEDIRWDILNKYICEIADRMGLAQWRFILSHKRPPKDSGSIAYVRYSFQQRFFTLYFYDDFFTDTDMAYLREIVVHELCHVIEASRLGVVDALREEDIISQAFWKSWWGHYHRERELAIDAFSRLIAPQMPLLDWTSISSRKGRCATKTKGVNNVLRL